MLAVGLTLFRSSPEQIDRILAQYAGSGHTVIAFHNGGVSTDDLARLTRREVRVLSATVNVGVGAAMNALAEAAAEAGASDLLILDQDAQVGPAMIRDLAAARERLKSLQVPVALVGPSPGQGAPGAKAPRDSRRAGLPARGTLVPVEFLATSGSLIDLAAFARVGPFRADYFIDGVEIEWCFRAWAAGYGCWMAEDVTIGHRVGTGTIRALAVSMPRQPLFRMATYLRNSVYGWRLGHIPLRWKLRQIAYLPLQVLLYWQDAGYRPAVLTRLAGAVLDGARGRLGRPQDAP